MKHSFYPTEKLQTLIRNEAKQRRQSIGQTVCDILELYFEEAETKGKKNSDDECTLVSDILDFLEMNSLRYEDKRDKGGNLWIFDFPQACLVLAKVEERFGWKFTFAPNGGKATGGFPAWYGVKCKEKGE